MEILSAVIAFVVFFVIINALMIFYKYYKESGKVNPYFPKNESKEQYLAALDSEPPATDEVLSQLLFRRAIEIVLRTKLIHEEKSSILNLNQAGALSEDLLNSFMKAEKETAEEVFEIQSEAEMLHEGWSKGILQEAAMFLKKQSEIAPNAKNASVTSLTSGQSSGSPVSNAKKTK